jgi:hypothetical protein
MDFHGRTAPAPLLHDHRARGCMPHHGQQRGSALPFSQQGTRSRQSGNQTDHEQGPVLGHDGPPPAAPATPKNLHTMKSNGGPKVLPSLSKILPARVFVSIGSAACARCADRMRKTPAALSMPSPRTPEARSPEKRIPTGARILLSLGAADRYLDRQPHEAATGPGQTARGRTLAFGHGPHYCPGAHLARLQAHIAVAALAARLPRPRADRRTGPAACRAGRIFHGPEQLLVSPLARLRLL